MNEIEERIDRIVARIQEANEDLRRYQDEGFDLMIKATKKRRAGLRGALTRAQKQAGLI